MIPRIKLRFGRSSLSEPEWINTTSVTVFVGPNHSGKSRLLEELEHHCRNGRKRQEDLILDSIEVSPFDEDGIEAVIEQLKDTPRDGEVLGIEHVIIGGRHGRHNVHKPVLRQILSAPQNNLPQFCMYYLTQFVLKLDGNSRLGLLNQTALGDLQLPAHGTLQVLFRNDVKRKRVRDIVKDALNFIFTVDPTNPGHVRVRLNNREPASTEEERGLHEHAVAYHSKSSPIEHASDGVKAFVGIIAELIAGDPKVLLIDEPEAFLHPSIAVRLGKELALAASGEDKKLFVSTHSPFFLMGCVQAGTEVNVIRLTYRNSVPTARLLPSADLLPLMRNPLLRAIGVLSGLFYECVVVTESDSDRVFYQEINERLLSSGNDRGIPNCLFLNAQNKQTLHIILKPLRQLGIPVAAIADIDVLKEGGSVWSNIMNGCHFPDVVRNSLSTTRASIKSALESTGRDMKNDGGLDLLGTIDREGADLFFRNLEEYGLFVVPGGECESWLKSLGIVGHGSNWLVSILEKLGHDPTDPAYIKPAENDVWQFLQRVRQWLLNPDRKGVPS